MIKILHFATSYSARTQTFVRDLYHRQQEDPSYDARLICLDRPNERPLNEKGITSLPYHPHEGGTATKIRSKLRGRGAVRHDPVLAAALREYLQKWQPDIILVYFGDAATLLYAHLDEALRRRMYWCVLILGYDGSSYPRNRPGYVRELKKLLAQRNVLTWFVCDFLRRQLVLYSVLSYRHVVRPLAIDCDKFHPPVKPAAGLPVFLQVGAFREKKAQMDTLAAFELVLKSRPDARLQLAGSGKDLALCQLLAQKQGISGQVDFLGFVSPAATPELYRNATVYVHPSKTAAAGTTEGAPVSIGEAMATDLAIVATRHAGIPELVTSPTCGILVAEHSPEQLAVAMLAALDLRPAGRNRSHALAHFSTKAERPWLARQLNQLLNS
ncbi:MAG: glycosyltransferase family 4 protein [Saprospiraceae bacterium]